MKERRYPVGIQTFSEIVEGGYVYVDKTDLMWEMQRYAKYAFLSRPRRFGKSLLSSTFASFFRGEKDLFEGLKVMELEQNWYQHPVLHLDVSIAKHQRSADELRSTLIYLLKPYVKTYGEDKAETTPGLHLAGLIQRAYEQTGRKVVVIIDEYDAPLLESLHDETELSERRQILQEFYQNLKPADAYLQFCFITGITKFSQLSIFSALNNITNLTMDSKFSAICGITEKELTTILSDDIRMLADTFNCTWEEMHERLKQQYDGYHFSENAEDIYNPFSLVKCFLQKRIENYWFESGTPTFLIQQLQRFGTDITALDKIEAPAMAFDRPTESMSSALPLLYQSGYLTIKSYNEETGTYRLGIPNKEVRIGYAEGLLPTYTGLEGSDVQMGFALKFWKALRTDNIEAALHELQTYLASLPYVEGFKKKLAEISNAEGFYEWTFYLIFSMLNVYARTQVKCNGGRIDIVVEMPRNIYVIELKLNGSAQKALEQIKTKGYALPYATDPRETVMGGINFSSETRTITDWKVETTSH